MSREQQVSPIPEAFTQALQELARASVRDELAITEIPAPHRLAPYALALSGEVTAGAATVHGNHDRELARTRFLDSRHDLATGRFVLLYDPQGQELWNGSFRIVTYIRAGMEQDLGQDSMLASVAWSWFEDALRGRGADYHSAGGTATRVISESFGQLSCEEPSVEIELRVSWSPQGPDLGRHLSAWGDMVCSFAGVEPLPEGVHQLPLHRRS